MQQWNNIYKGKKEVWNGIQEDFPKILALFNKYNVKRVLDLGCGSGRHTVYFAKKGFDVYGIDIAEEGINATKDLLKKERLQADLKTGSMYNLLPYPDSFFDAVISTQTIHHGDIKNIKNVIKEIERILRPKGLIFITIRKKRYDKDKYKKISHREYIKIAGEEKGLIHYLFNKDLLKKEFKGFKILDIWTESNKIFYCLLGELKVKKR